MRSKNLITKANIILFIILVVAAVLRLYTLASESFWLDELHTMKETNPNGGSWGDLIHTLQTSDVHPPLFYVMERLSLKMFGFDEWGARILPAIAGIFCVWAIYLLGKEILNKSLGLIAAAVLAVNYYNILFSQEARDYTFLWLFTTLSYLFFLKLCKRLKTIDAIWWVISTVLLLYSHYYSLIVLICQGVLFAIFFFTEKENKKRFFTIFAISAVAIIVLYSPWIPAMRAASKIQSFWSAPVEQNFYLLYFNEYFGYSAFLNFFLYLFVISFIVNVMLEYSPTNDLKSNPVIFSFIFVFISIFLSYSIPYIRGVLVVPMLVTRYTIIMVPSLILAIAFGIQLIKTPIVRYIFLTLFVSFSVFHLVKVRHYYSNAEKEQFREVTQVVTSQPSHHLLINGLTGWHQSYYLQKFGYRGRLIEGWRDASIDSIIRRDGSFATTDTFWVVGAHGDPHLDSAVQTSLDSVFVRLQDTTLIETWAQLYARKK
ncbi:glycosyltransferase family 39 protein [Polluticoccus soli]|uniref:glycosyltransferase family 39 protein n=1 Tax=Polluticoccus soli TaxID=3034150 RepID=UPI0023E09AB3|nr:glycosyltransferase family 39 protein [Flavipsychrobacter sp. JY13-12]